jgi:hypothetical protein
VSAETPLSSGPIPQRLHGGTVGTARIIPGNRPTHPAGSRGSGPVQSDRSRRPENFGPDFISVRKASEGSK